MIIDKHKCIFIHIPKCAGVSIEYALTNRLYNEVDREREILKQHATAAQVKKYYCSDDDWNNYFKFAIIRNPFDRLLSAFNYLLVIGLIHDGYKEKYISNWQNRKTINYILFKSFILKGKSSIYEKIMNRYKYGYNHIKPITEYLFNDGKLMVDFIGRFENLQNDWDVICERIGTKINLPRMNVFTHKNYKECYDEEMIEIVKNRYKNDLELFGYDF